MIVYAIIAGLLYLVAAGAFFMAISAMQEIEGVLFAILATLFLVVGFLEKLCKTIAAESNIWEKHLTRDRE